MDKRKESSTDDGHSNSNIEKKVNTTVPEQTLEQTYVHTSTPAPAPPPAPSPARYRLYDGIKAKVSLQTMDKIIFAIIALIVILLLIGIIKK